MDKIKNIMIYAVIGFVMMAVVIGFIYAGKHLSFFFFYEGLVRDTITEMVKAGSLK